MYCMEEGLGGGVPDCGFRGLACGFRGLVKGFRSPRISERFQGLESGLQFKRSWF